VSGVDNTISGSGFRAVDARALAPAPSLYNTNLSGWAFHAKVTFWTYLQYHPLAAMWLGIVVTALLALALTRTRRRPAHPYPHSTRWRGEAEPAETVTAANEVQLAAQGGVPAYDSPFTATYRPGPPMAAFGNAPDPAIDFTPASRWPAAADHGSLSGPGSPPRHSGRHSRQDPIPAFGRPAMGAQPAGPGNSAGNWPTAPDGLAGLAGAAPVGPGGRGDTGGPVDQGSESWVPRWLDSGMYRETGAHDGAPIPGLGADDGSVPGRSASSDETAAARPPWSTAPMPKLDSGSQYRDQIDPYAPWPGEVDRP
jgi:hypothetical protein